MDADLSKETFLCPMGAETPLGDVISARIFVYAVEYLRMPLELGYVRCPCGSYHLLGPEQLVSELAGLGYRRVPMGNCPPRDWMLEYGHVLDDPEAALAMLLSDGDLELEGRLLEGLNAGLDDLLTEGRTALLDEAVTRFADQLDNMDHPEVRPTALTELFATTGVPTDIVDR